MSENLDFILMNIIPQALELCQVKNENYHLKNSDRVYTLSMNADFVTWLTTAIDSRGWNNSELARRAGMVPSTISMVISGHNQPSMEFCIKVAQALGEAPEHVLRIAGHLPSLPEPVPDEHELLRWYRQLPPPVRLAMVTTMRHLAERGIHVNPHAEEPEYIERVDEFKQLVERATERERAAIRQLMQIIREEREERN